MRTKSGLVEQLPALPPSAEAVMCSVAAENKGAGLLLESQALR